MNILYNIYRLIRDHSEGAYNRDRFKLELFSSEETELEALNRVWDLTKEYSSNSEFIIIKTYSSR